MSSPSQAYNDRIDQALEELPSSHRYTSKQLELIYSIGYNFATQNRFEEALPLFAFLTQYGPTTKHYLMGLGLCLQRLERYHDAIQVYSFLGMIEPDQPDATVQVAECYINANMPEEAREALRLVITFAEKNNLQNAVVTRAHALLKFLQGNKVEQ